MAAPTPITGGYNFKCDFILYTGQSGWTETYYLNLSIDSFQGAFAHAKGLWSLRRMLAHEDVYIRGIRITELQSIQASRPFNQPAFGTGTAISGAVAGDAAYPETAWIARMAEASQVYKRTLWFRGLPEVYDTWEPLQAADPLVPDNLRTAFANLRVRLTSDFEIAGSGTGKWTIRAWTKAGGVETSEPITSWGIDPASLAFRFKAPTATFIGGQEIKISGVRGPGMKGVNGETKIVALQDAGGGATWYLINKMPKCPGGTIFPTALGFAKTSRYEFYQMATGDLVRISDHDTGPPSGLSRGRQSSSKC